MHNALGMVGRWLSSNGSHNQCAQGNASVPELICISFHGRTEPNLGAFTDGQRAGCQPEHEGLDRGSEELLMDRLHGDVALQPWSRPKRQQQFLGESRLLPTRCVPGTYNMKTYG
jgi:hypothetical protein